MEQVAADPLLKRTVFYYRFEKSSLDPKMIWHEDVKD